MKVAFGTVIYEETWVYKDDYIYSLNAQRDCQFDVLIINDNVSERKIKELEKQSHQNMHIFSKPYQMSIAELRVYLLLIAKKIGYDLLILGDFDDVFHPNRVKCFLEAYSERYGFYYNALFTLDKKKAFKVLPDYMCSYEEILEQNFLGMSNTALNLKLISETFIKSLSEGRTNIFDWYLYTKLLLADYQGYLVKRAITYYRIHDNNIAGISGTTRENIQKELAVKKIHYLLLRNATPRFEQIYMQYLNVTKDNYTQYLNKEDNGYWWSKIRVETGENKNV